MDSILVWALIGKLLMPMWMQMTPQDQNVVMFEVAKEFGRKHHDCAKVEIRVVEIAQDPDNIYFFGRCIKLQKEVKNEWERGDRYRMSLWKN